MNHGNPGPDDAPAPPTSTGWSRDEDSRDDDLAPPFVPGEAAPAEDDDTGSLPFEYGWDDEGEAGASEEDAFPVDAFDIEGDEAGWGTEPGSAVAGGDAAPVSPPAAGAGESREMEAAREIAGRLEDMARRLRDQGPAAARAEIDSPDRFTSLLAGLLSGYLAGRD